MVNEAVAELKGEPSRASRPRSSSTCPLDANLPPDYVRQGGAAARGLPAAGRGHHRRRGRRHPRRVGGPLRPGARGGPPLLDVARLRAECHRLGIREINVTKGPAFGGPACTARVSPLTAQDQPGDPPQPPVQGRGLQGGRPSWSCSRSPRRPTSPAPWSTSSASSCPPAEDSTPPWAAPPRMLPIGRLRHHIASSVRAPSRRPPPHAGRPGRARRLRHRDAAGRHGRPDEISRDTLQLGPRGRSGPGRGDPLGDQPHEAVKGTWSAATTAQLLGRPRIRYELLGLALKANHITVSQSDRTSAEQSLCSRRHHDPADRLPGPAGLPEGLPHLPDRARRARQRLPEVPGRRRQRRPQEVRDAEGVPPRPARGAVLPGRHGHGPVDRQHDPAAGGRRPVLRDRGGRSTVPRAGRQAVPALVGPAEGGHEREERQRARALQQPVGRPVRRADPRAPDRHLRRGVGPPQAADHDQATAGRGPEAAGLGRGVGGPAVRTWARQSGTVVPPKGPSSATSTSSVPAGSSTSG